MIKSREKNSNTRQASRLFYVDGCIIDQRTALKDNRGRAPVRVHIEGFFAMRFCWTSLGKIQNERGIGASPGFSGDGDVSI